MNNPYIPIEPRLWGRCIKQPNGCWLWQGCKCSGGYGKIHYMGRQDLTHRVAYTITKGNPTGFVVMHVCDTPACINPEHLVLGTQKDNLKDCWNKGRYSNHNAKLTPMQVDEIKAKYIPRKYGTTKLSREYNVSVSTIRRAILGISWKYVYANSI